jgi:hypothetical protein
MDNIGTDFTVSALRKLEQSAALADPSTVLKQAHVYAMLAVADEIKMLRTLLRDLCTDGGAGDEMPRYLRVDAGR